MVAEIAVEPALVAVNEGKLPVPLAPKPIAVFEFDQENVVPAWGEVKVVIGTVAVGQ